MERISNLESCLSAVSSGVGQSQPWLSKRVEKEKVHGATLGTCVHGQYSGLLAAPWEKAAPDAA